MGMDDEPSISLNCNRDQALPRGSRPRPRQAQLPVTDCAQADPRHGGGHSPRGRLLFVLGLTATFMVVEAVGGWISGSLALLADAGHMLTDVAAIGLRSLP